MALTLTIIPPAQQAVANMAMNFVASVTNSGSAAVTLTSLAVSETESDASLSQPVFVTPNLSPGAGNPSLLPSTTYYYPFQVVFNSPYSAGPSPNAPGGTLVNAAGTPDPTFTLQLQALSSDGTVASTSLMATVLAAVAPFPIPLGGALQVNMGANLINLLTM